MAGKLPEEWERRCLPGDVPRSAGADHAGRGGGHTISHVMAADQQESLAPMERFTQRESDGGAPHSVAQDDPRRGLLLSSGMVVPGRRK